MAKDKRFYLIFVAVIGLIIESSMAHAYLWGVQDILSNGINIGINFFQDDMNRAFIVVLSFFVLLLAVFKVALQRVKVFQNDNGTLNNPGKAVMFVLAISGMIGIMFAGPQSFYEMVERFLDFSRIYGLVAIGALTFWLVYAVLGLGGDDDAS